MRPEDIDARWADAAWPELHDRVAEALAQVDAAATHLARAAVGLAVAPRSRELLLGAIARAQDTRMVTRIMPAHDGVPALMGLVAALHGDWDLVARCTDGDTLPMRVVKQKQFPAWNASGLVRHLATAARAKLPATYVVAAMHGLRDTIARGAVQPDNRLAVLAAQLFVRDIAGLEDPVAATCAWLAGQDVALEPQEAVRAIADGADPRVAVFERYLEVLGDDAAIDRDLATYGAARYPAWSRDVEGSREKVDEAVIRGFLARRPLFAGWETEVDPMVASWLGTPSTPEIEQRFRDVALLARRTDLNRGFGPAVRALVAGKPDVVRQVTGMGTLTAFKPGKLFKDDPRKLIRYLASAVIGGAQLADVEPAWLDFLCRRTPHGDELSWKQLLAIQAALVTQLGRGARETAGTALQRIVTGV